MQLHENVHACAENNQDSTASTVVDDVSLQWREVVIDSLPFGSSSLFSSRNRERERERERKREREIEKERERERESE